MNLLLSSFRANMCTPKGKTHSREAEKPEDFRMNEKTARQIAEMKNQTIGVEVEMNSITARRQRRLPPPTSAQADTRTLPSRNGYSTWSAWDADGREWKFQKDVFHRRAGRAEMRTGYPNPDLRRHRNPAGALQAAQTRRRQERCLQRMRSPHPHRGAGGTRHRAFGTSPTSWRATKA